MSPLVSIIIPTRDRIELLGQTIESVRRQSWPAWEVIVVDDGSTDATEKVVQGISAAEPRVCFLKRTGRRPGANACRNQGLQHSRGDYVLFLDSDDLLDAGCVAGRVEFMEGHPTLGFAVWPGRVFLQAPGDTEVYWNTLSEEDDLPRFLRGDVPWQTSGPLWRPAALAKVGEWDEGLSSWQDWDFHVRALCAGIAYQKLGGPDYSVRRGHDARISQSRRRDQLVNRVQMLIRTAAILKDRGLFRSTNRDDFASLLWLLARQCVSGGRSIRGALTIWHTCRKQGFVTGGRYFHGVALLAWARLRGALSGRAWIDHSWYVERSQQCRATVPSTTLPSTTVSHAAA